MKAGAGPLDKRVRFEERGTVNEPQGNTEGAWVQRFTRWSRVRPSNSGNETVIASRLQGVVPYEITVRSDPQTKTIREGWRAINNETGETYNIGPASNPDERGRYLTFTATTGTAHG